MQIYANWFYDVILLFSSLKKCINSNHCKTLVCSLIELKLETRTLKELFYLTVRNNEDS